jgi:hypothetical protein
LTTQDMIGSAARTPAASHLFSTNDTTPIALDKEQSETYVHLVMQLLYLSQQACPELQTAVSFLCGWLKSPDTDDYKKLGQVMKYLQSTVDLPLVLSANGSGSPYWWVDASALCTKWRREKGCDWCVVKSCV